MTTWTAPKTIEEVQTQIVVNAARGGWVEIKTDRKGREFAQYYSRAAGRWIRCGLADAKLALAMVEEAA